MAKTKANVGNLDNLIGGIASGQLGRGSTLLSLLFGNLLQNGGGSGGGFGGGGFQFPGTGGSGGNSGQSPDLKGMPQWWIDWYNSQGKYGGVPPSAPSQQGGLLD